MLKLKTFQYTDLPEEIKEDSAHLFEGASDQSYRNCYIEDLENNTLAKWLSENGADEGEMVLLLLSW